MNEPNDGDTIATFTDGDTPVTWSRKRKRHTVHYGKQVTHCTDSLQACHEFGECVRHSLECAGKLDI